MSQFFLIFGQFLLPESSFNVEKSKSMICLKTAMTLLLGCNPSVEKHCYLIKVLSLL